MMMKTQQQSDDAADDQRMQPEGKTKKTNPP